MAKSERASISFSDDLMDPMDRLVDEAFAGNRSAYVDSLVRADLESRGRLARTPSERALARAKAALDAVGAEAFEAHLEQLLSTAAAGKGVSP